MLGHVFRADTPGQRVAFEPQRTSICAAVEVVRGTRYDSGMSGTGAGASYGDLLITSLLVLGAVCVAAFVTVRVLGRVLATGRARGRHLLDVVARVSLEPRRSLYVVEVAGKTLLVGTSEMGLSVLSELDGSEVKARVEQQPTFGELVRRAFGQRRGLAAMRERPMAGGDSEETAALDIAPSEPGQGA
jgi:flagellar biogenesis protein FliO